MCNENIQSTCLEYTEILLNTKLINDHTTSMFEEVFSCYPYIRLVHLNDNLIILSLKIS